MKYMLIMHMNPVVWDGLSEADRNAIMDGHGGFMAAIKESGEMVTTHALSAPENSAVVRVRDGVPAVTDGPYVEAKEFLAGFYIVDCESKERAYEVAAMIPDAAYEGFGIEVRPIMFSAGLEM
ncbi:MAG: hypothetical protein JWQ81_4298 [Amycolatopsis sp.]|jgi:hypothetical protein|uniref:YciI family protein n=1 Tax=Amycolatopsis sp. TaxID=37632 RepID=UPI00260A8037|nr:YciI family protein [Amycolatopsis sp.]MCU1683559.1 hypothetical protein [Amycolatopsis sp.]